MRAFAIAADKETHRNNEARDGPTDSRRRARSDRARGHRRMVAMRVMVVDASGAPYIKTVQTAALA
jgi:hypothetical protein